MYLEVYCTSHHVKGYSYSFFLYVNVPKNGDRYEKQRAAFPESNSSPFRGGKPGIICASSHALYCGYRVMFPYHVRSTQTMISDENKFRCKGMKSNRERKKHKPWVYLLVRGLSLGIWLNKWCVLVSAARYPPFRKIIYAFKVLGS